MLSDCKTKKKLDVGIIQQDVDSLRPFAARTIGSFREDDLEPLATAGRLYRGAWFGFTTRRSLGTNIYDREWDALVVLDACRVDALRAVVDEFEFLDVVNSIRSLGSHSHEWMTKTFTDAHRAAINSTAYVVGNGFAKRTFEDGQRPLNSLVPSTLVPFDTVDAAAFDDFVGVWEHGHDDSLGNIPPRYITDRAIETARSERPERLVVHYNQPHAPYLAAAIAADSATTETERDPFTALRSGDTSRKVILQAYLDNLRLVLNEVRLLLANLDAETVIITADHGEAFGEWGQFGHPRATLNPVVRRVPWVETTATDTGTHTPKRKEQQSETDLKSHLADLGYID